MSQSLSRRQRALELCRELLNDLDREKIGAVTAVRRLNRIAQLIDDEEVLERTDQELDGYSGIIAATVEEAIDRIEQLKSDGEIPPNLDAEKAARDAFSKFPRYRILSLAVHSDYSYLQSSFRTVSITGSLSEYEELLAQVRRQPRVNFTMQLPDGTSVRFSASELNGLISGTLRWVDQEVSRIESTLEFGAIPQGILDNTFKFVDDALFRLVPQAAERLTVAYRNLAERNRENWQNVVDTCRRVMKDFADAVYPPQSQMAHGMIVDESHYLNRIRAFVLNHTKSRRVRQHVAATLELLAELLARTDNLASRGVHAETTSRYDAERVLIYTYLSIGDILTLSGLHNRPEASISRVSLNSASLEELQSSLALSKAVAAEIIKHRKHQDFQSWEDVATIKGIGPKTLERLKSVASI